MRALTHWAIIAVALPLTACAVNDRSAGSAPVSTSAILRDAAGIVRAEATATQIGNAVRINVSATDMATGSYGAHIHTTGRCGAPEFTSAGPHWNPAIRKHGKDNPEGMHKGDLPNLMIGSNRRGSLEY